MQEPQIVWTEDLFRVEMPSEDGQIDPVWEGLKRQPWETIYGFGFSDPMNPDRNVKFLVQVGQAFCEALRMAPDLEAAREQLEVPLDPEVLERLEMSAPFGPGRQYLNAGWIERLWKGMEQVFSREAGRYEGTMQAYLEEKNKDLPTAQRVYFHLVENRQAQEEGYPFVFLATYAVKTSASRIRQVPLSHIFREYDKSDPQLLAMLSALSKAADLSVLLDDFMISGEIFHPLKLTSQEAWEILKVVPDLEKIGICTRIPNWWKKKSASASITVTMGGKKPALLGMETILTMRPSLVIDGKKLSKAEIRELLAMDEGLHLIKGSWVEVDHERLKKLLEQMEAYDGEVTLAEALRQSAGLESAGPADVPVQVENAAWLSKMTSQLKEPALLRSKALPKTVHAILRPYQKEGVAWLNSLASLGFGACLADDMGLGKTLQVLAFLETWRKTNPNGHVLLVVPASLLGNWQKEIEKFTPAMPFMIVHGTSGRQEMEKGQWPFLTITTYGMAVRLEELQKENWDILILDEAQAIKNPKTRQTRTLKQINARHKLALTGTPVENDLSNLWSIFDFLNSGLLGTAREFSEFSKRLEEHPENYGRLQQVIAPFLLRRLKTDKSILQDLPDKMEISDYVSLSKKQTVLYNQKIQALEKQLQEPKAEGIARKGLVLSALSDLKQICNHPDQFLGQEEFRPEDSGKFEMLKEICTNIKDSHECVLVFTQYKEMIPWLDSYLKEIFEAPGLVIHGGTPAKKRTELTEAFNRQETYIPYMVLSLRAAGTGLNLTAASHVIHFDRWWNPAVENQATDRAYRIGQTKNVVVHKLVSKGTIEEKIEEMIENKKELAEKVIGEGQAKWLTEMSNDELLSLLRLDV